MPTATRPAGVQEQVLREHRLSDARVVRMTLAPPYPSAKVPVYTVAVAVPRLAGGVVLKQARHTPYRHRADVIFDALAAGRDVPPDASAPKLTGRYDEVYTHWVAAGVQLTPHGDVKKESTRVVA